MCLTITFLLSVGAGIGGCLHSGATGEARTERDVRGRSIDFGRNHDYYVLAGDFARLPVYPTLLHPCFGDDGWQFNDSYRCCHEKTPG